VAAAALAYHAALSALSAQAAADPSTTWTVVRWILAASYWFIQGTLFWGTFVLGHDCGHSSFSASPVLNWVVGNILHTAILTPYESWRISHRHHHQNTGNIDKDEIFFPARQPWHKRIQYFTVSLGLAWFLYLMTGYSPRNVYHFNPNDQLFQEHRAVAKVAVSVSVYAGWCAYLYHLSSVYGWWALADYYFIPLFVFGSWLVITTFLHHNEPAVPWYSDKEWSFVKGALSSVDRDYSPFNSIIHNIGTHQVHHLFPQIPHYHLVEATKSFRAAFPDHTRVSTQSVFAAFAKNLGNFLRQGPLPDDVAVFAY